MEQVEGAVLTLTWLFAFRHYIPLVGVANLLWESAQLPLYTIWIEGSPAAKVFAVLHCTAGDVLIASTSLLGELLFVGHPGWPNRRYWPVAAWAVLLGFGYTVFSEWLNTHIRASWSYRDLMPTLLWLGIGLTPLVQWLVIPSAGFVWLRRKQLNSAERKRI